MAAGIRHHIRTADRPSVVVVAGVGVLVGDGHLAAVVEEILVFGEKQVYVETGQAGILI